MHNVVRQYAKLSHFNYDKQGKDWKVNVSGERQSPILLDKEKAIRSSAPKLTFVNYHKTLSGPLKLANNGHTVVMHIPPAIDGTQPAICGCKLDCIYMAKQLHLHWGSPCEMGSEHMLGCSRYHGELHVLHMNSAYESIKEAIHEPDGFLVLAVLLRVVCSPEMKLRSLEEIFKNVCRVKNMNMTATIDVPVTLRDILVLSGAERAKFFTYQGSLTTPPCAEVVTWFVFTKPVEVLLTFMEKFWNLQDDRGKPLLNNYRELQDTCGRKVYYRDDS